MSSSMPLRPVRVEQVVTYLRVFGFTAGLPTIMLATFPDTAHAELAWGTEGVLLLGTLALWLWRRHARPSDERLLLAAGFVVDTMVIAGFVLAFSHLIPNVSWAMVFTLLADAALRFGVRGAVLGLVLSGLLFVVQVQAHEAATGVVTTAAALLYVLATLVGAAGILAVFTATLERQAVMAQEQALALSDANRVRERLLAMSSHEFRGSLAAMMLASETVRANLDRLGPERAVSLLAEVDRHGRHLSRLVDDLFAVAQASSEAIRVRKRWEDLDTSVEQALAAAERHRDGHQLTVSVEQVGCELDHERFIQVVRNLVENAYKYAPGGSRVVVMATHRDGRVELRVGDDGPGIPASEREHVFEPFGRRRDAAERHDSAGLGLYVVQQIVSAMGGSLDLHTSSAGTEFVVVLPAAASASLQVVPDVPPVSSVPEDGDVGRQGPTRQDAAGH